MDRSKSNFKIDFSAVRILLMICFVCHFLRFFCIVFYIIALLNEGF